MRVALSLLVIVWATVGTVISKAAQTPLATASLPLAACQDIRLDQTWTDQQRYEFWFKPQGSRIMPYKWFVSLESARATTMLKDSLADLGFIYAPSNNNPETLPIGFGPDPSPDPMTNPSVGLTCAACHTSRLVFNGTPIIVEGGPSLGDMTGLLRRFEETIAANVEDSAKFDRLIVRVLGPNPTPAQIDALKTGLFSVRQMLETQWNAHWPVGDDAGPGRVDAFGLIYNRVLAYDIGASSNARAVDAPVSYPFLWNTPQHDRVQWNGMARNRIAGIALDLLPLVRNVGEVLGVFAHLEIIDGRPYKSSVRVKDLHALEKLVEGLRPPAWPEGCAPINEALLPRGRDLYVKHCRRCHEDLDRNDLDRRFKAKMVSAFDVGTDLKMVTNFANRYNLTPLATGRLKNHKKVFAPTSFGEQSTGIEMLTHLVFKAIYGDNADALARAMSPAEERAVSRAAARVVREVTRTDLQYKARPLTGVWATAPFLHNGSVPSVEELLKPSDQRLKQFHVGNQNFDVDRIGLSTTPASNSQLFDTTKPGNSNAGHEYGTTLPHNDKQALIEYLKVIGQRKH